MVPPRVGVSSYLPIRKMISQNPTQQDNCSLKLPPQAILDCIQMIKPNHHNSLTFMLIADILYIYKGNEEGKLVDSQWKLRSDHQHLFTTCFKWLMFSLKFCQFTSYSDGLRLKTARNKILKSPREGLGPRASLKVQKSY